MRTELHDPVHSLTAYSVKTATNNALKPAIGNVLQERHYSSKDEVLIAASDCKADLLPSSLHVTKSDTERTLSASYHSFPNHSSTTDSCVAPGGT